MAIPQFGLRRLHVIVPDGLYACFETSQSGFQRSPWRVGEPGTPGTWSEEPPVVLEGEYMLVVTAVDAGSTFQLDIIDLDDNPDCDEEDSGSSIPELCG